MLLENDFLRQFHRILTAFEEAEAKELVAQKLSYIVPPHYIIEFITPMVGSTLTIT